MKLALALAISLLLCSNISGDDFLDQFKPRMHPATSPTLNQPTTSAPQVDGNWKLVWSDEFDGPALDQTKWQFEVNGKGGGNGELQYYTDRPANLQVRDGHLIISANKEEFHGPDGKRNYTSARITSKGKGDWKYGRFEARIKMPKGKGMWPAFWMMPTDSVYGTWARSGELDIAEVIGHEPNLLYGTIHYGDKWPKNVRSGEKVSLPSGDFSDDFHVFGIEWKQGEITWTLDGKPYGTQTNWRTAAAPFPAPFDQRFYFILNLAVGGSWPGPPNGSTAFPQKMEVDWVRAYQPISAAPSEH